jgi:inositol transport system ATP-binding protein
MGAGRTEVMRAIFGLDPHGEGEIKVHGKAVRIASVNDGIRAKIAMLSEDRHRYGIIPMRSVSENVSLASLGRFIHHGRLHRREESTVISRLCEELSVKSPSLGTPVEALSGGNQQKVVLGKWILSDPDILIMDEPTRGIDVGAKYEIYKLMDEIAKKGKTLIFVSSELPELIGMCDRIYVMCQGKIAGELAKGEFSQEGIMRLATGQERERA